MAKKKSYLEILNEKQAATAQRKAEGKVNFKEDSRATRVQYSLPNYQGKSDTDKTYKWEQELLKDYKPKGARSYNDKFEAFAAEQGLTPGQAKEFRRFLDFQEDSAWQEPELNKDGTIKQNQSLNPARGAYMMGDEIDNILNSMTQKQTENYQKANDRNQYVQFEKTGKIDNILDSLGLQRAYGDQAENQNNYRMAKELGFDPDKDKVTKEEWNYRLKKQLEKQEKEKEAQTPTELAGKENSFFDDLLRSGKSALEIATGTKTPGESVNDMAMGYVEDGARPSSTSEELSRGITRASNTASLGVLKELSKSDPEAFARNFGQREGGEAAADMAYDMLGYLGTGAAAYKLLNGAKAGKALTQFGSKGLAQRLASEAAKGGIIGAGISGAEVGVREGLNADDYTAAENAKYIGLNTALGAVADPAIYGAGKGISNVLGRMAKVDGELPTFSGNVSDDVLKSLSPNRYTNENMLNSNSFYDELINPTPKPEVVPENSLPKTPEIQQAEDDLLEAWNRRQQHEDDFVMQQLAPYRESQQNAANAQSEWQTVKQMQEMAKRIKDSYGGIVLDGNSKDFINAIPIKFRAKKGVRGDDIYKFAEQEGFSSPDEAVQFLQQLDQATKTKLKELNPENDGLKITDEQWAELEEAARRSFADSEDGKAIDTLIDDLMNVHSELASTRTVEPNVNNSQAIEPTNPTVDAPEQALESLVRNETSEESPDLLLRLNSQKFNDETTQTPKLFSDGEVGSEKAITRQRDKFYENYINSNHSFKVAETKVLENEIKRLEGLGGAPKKVAQLKQQLKEVKKSGSPLEKALSNELGSGVAAKEFLKRHFKELDSIVKSDEEMAQALTYQLARDLDWRKKHGFLSDEYVINEGVDWGHINEIINRGQGNETFKNFNAAFRNLTQEWRDIMLQYGLINKESYDALSKNPYYMPLARDFTPGMSNVDKGMSGRQSSNTRSSGPTILHSISGGDVKALFKNPIDTLVNNTFAVYKNAYKEETGRQMLRLAKLDKDGLFFQEVSKKATGGNIARISNSGKERYVRVQDDLMQVMKENEEYMNMDFLGKITSAFASLKTRSLEYQSGAIVRDLGSGYVNSQVTNPFRYAGEVMKAIKDKNASVKEVAGYFDKAYNDHTGGVDPNKILDEFKKQQGVTVVDPKNKESWKKAVTMISKIFDTVTKPVTALGQFVDEIPRDIEVRETERLFMKKHGQQIQNIQNRLDEVNGKIRQSQNATDPFDPALQGVDKLQSQKAKLEGMLEQFNRDLKREQVFRSRDVMNYKRQGRGGVAKKIKQWVIFANTTTQSKDKLVRSFIERPGATIFKTAITLSPLIAAQKIMYETMSDSDKKIYDDTPSYIKNFNYVFVQDGHVVALPKLHELALISNPIEAALNGESFSSSMKLLAKELTPYQLGNITQGLIPDEEGKTLLDSDPIKKSVVGVTAPSTVLTPFADVMSNDKTGFNRKPISYNSDQANEWTLDVFKDLVGDNPNADRVEYLIRQLGGDYGKYGAYTADFLKDFENEDKLDEMLRYLNPAQDRLYSPNSGFFRQPIQETKQK